MVIYTTKSARGRLRQKLEAMADDLLKRELTLMGASKLYLVFDSDTMLDYSGVKGFTSRSASVDFRAEIGSRWHGPGPCIFMNVSEYADSESCFQGLVALLIHELAHIFQFGPPNDFYCETSFGKFEGVVSDLRETMPREERSISKHKISDYAWQAVVHGHDWIRPLIHLMTRAEQAGWKFSRDDVADWKLVGFTDA
ncbi:MAG: hypothetical protein V4719_02465, partial [Planctomycetota bacterium]